MAANSASPCATALTATNPTPVNGLRLKTNRSEHFPNAYNRIQQIEIRSESGFRSFFSCPKSLQSGLRDLHQDLAPKQPVAKEQVYSIARQIAFGAAGTHLQQSQPKPASYLTHHPAFAATVTQPDTYRWAFSPTHTFNLPCTYAFTAIYTHLQKQSTVTYTLTPPLKGVSVTVGPEGGVG